jgi:hypothetical protein
MDRELSLDGYQSKSLGGRSNPRNIPKFEDLHAETGFDRECVSSNPLTPASQSFNRRLYSRISQKGPPIAGFCRLVRRL